MRRIRVFWAAVTLLGVSACGVPDIDLSSPDRSERDDGTRTDETVLASGAPTGDTVLASGDNRALLANDPNNPWVVGWQVSGPEGSEVTVAQNVFTEIASEESSISFAIGDEEFYQLYSGWVIRADVTVTVDSGGPVTFDIYIGRIEDTDTYLGVEIREISQTAELAVGESATLRQAVD